VEGKEEEKNKRGQGEGDNNLKYICDICFNEKYILNGKSVVTTMLYQIFLYYHIFAAIYFLN